MTLAPEAVRTMFDRIAPVYDSMNRVMTAGLDLRWRRLAAAAGRAAGRPRARRRVRHGRPRARRPARGRGGVTGLDFSAAMLERARRKSHGGRVGRGRPARAAVRGRRVRRGHGRLRRPQPRRRPRARPARAPPRAAARRPARDPRDHDAARPAAPVLRPLVRPRRARRRQGAAGRRRVHVPARVGEALPAAEELAALMCEVGFTDVRFRLLGGSIVAIHTGVARVTQLARRRDARASRRYMAALEQRLAQATARRPGLRRRCRRRGARGRRQAAAAAALLPRLAARRDRRRRSPRAWRSSSSTWRRSSTTTSSTARACAAARRPRGRSSAPQAALSAGDYLFACAFAELAETGDSAAVATLADACLALARGEAMQRSQTHDPETTIDAYLERCALKTGKLFEAACLLGSGGDAALGAFGLSLGIAFQIADDILDCAGQTQETGKIPGTDLREGTPTMPLLLAAQQDEVVRARARRRPARRRARARGRDRRARPLARGRARLRLARPLVPRLGHAPRGARSPDARRRGSGKLGAPWRSPSTPALDQVRAKVEAGERLDLEDGLALMESDDLLAIGELADLARRVRGGDDRVYFVQNLYLNQTNVCRVKCKFCAFAATQKQEQAYTRTRRRARRGRGARARGDRVHRDPHGQRREPARRLRLLRRHDREAPRARCRTCTSSATRRRRSTT